jgi:hypothetical protein
MEMLIMLVGVLVLEVAARRWGIDSREGEAHPEWERRTLRDARERGRRTEQEREKDQRFPFLKKKE